MTINYAVLIPSRGRPRILAGLFQRHPDLLHWSTFVGIENEERKQYEHLCPEVFDQTTVVLYSNRSHSCGEARERLRAYATGPRKEFDYYVTGDDNMSFKPTGDQKSATDVLSTLVKCCHDWQKYGLTIVAGLSAFKKYFDRNRKKTNPMTISGIRSFEGVGMILMCMPTSFYAGYTYPEDMYAGEDRHLILSAMLSRALHFRICEDAVFDKRRHQPGGQGSPERRQFNQGMGFARLARDFPFLMGGSPMAKRMQWPALHKLVQSELTRRLCGVRVPKTFDEEVSELHKIVTD